MRSYLLLIGAVIASEVEESSSACRGRKLGHYTWSTKLWKQGSRDLLDFFISPDGQEWGCGDLTINVGDSSAKRSIYSKDSIVPFIQAYRKETLNYESVIWLSYGDTVTHNGSNTDIFIDKFFDWIETITEDDANTLGQIGLSLDVEYMPAHFTEQSLIKAVARRDAVTNFPAGKLLINHVVDMELNPASTDAIMRLADSASFMLYRNYLMSSEFPEELNMLNRAKFFLTEQCERCLDDDHVAANYKAKVTFMVEASCGPLSFCAEKSFCAPEGGATYMWSTLMQLEEMMLSSGLITRSQFAHLFNPTTRYAVHDWKCMFYSTTCILNYL